MIKIEGKWVEWDKISVNELIAQLTLSTITKDELETQFRAHTLSDEATGWYYKKTYVKRVWAKSDPKKFTFD